MDIRPLFLSVGMNAGQPLAASSYDPLSKFKLPGAYALLRQLALWPLNCVTYLLDQLQLHEGVAMLGLQFQERLHTRDATANHALRIVRRYHAKLTLRGRSSL
jgi:hypothetical protein